MASARPTGPALATALLLVVLVVVVAVCWLPFLTGERRVIAATPSLGPLGPPVAVRVPAGSRLCVAPVPFDRRAARAVFHVRTGGRPARLAVEAVGPGYHARDAVVARDGGGFAETTAELRPARRTLTGRLCVANRGSRSVGLLANNEARSLTIAATTVGGEPIQDRDVALTLLEARPQSLIARSGQILGRASQLTGGLLPSWLLWPLTVLLVIGGPIAFVVSFYVAARRSDPA
jgi:hypothetical protein